MAYSEHLADRVRQIIPTNQLVEEKKMMGGLIFMVKGKMCLGVDTDRATGEDRLMVRVGKLPYKELLDLDHARQMDFTGKVMRGFLFIAPEGFDLDEGLHFWVEKALSFNKMIVKSL